MLVVRFKETFRERMPEWVLAMTMFGWGLAALGSPNLFLTEPFFTPMLLIMSQTAWGLAVFLVGAIRLIFLVINGAWRPSAHIRAVGCILGTLFWSARLVATLSLPYLAPIVTMYAGLILLDLLSLWFAAGDAKLADLSARGKLNTA